MQKSLIGSGSEAITTMIEGTRTNRTAILFNIVIESNYLLQYQYLEDKRDSMFWMKFCTHKAMRLCKLIELWSQRLCITNDQRFIQNQYIISLDDSINHSSFAFFFCYFFCC
ncbi:hypothetical protein Lalb_Chr15g0082351 [Lupinus albus]|uniref:Uncharacterized protein n=1 Tax=Lupinus albus TaxID=3870 RepID=A0A6A4P6W0_LUPAL|nr:hypothetical protein Lalb_Chr15g0082351 [Lupinus albus]